MKINAKFKQLGTNAAVLGVALLVFLASFVGLTMYGNAMKPDTVNVMVLTRDVQPGEYLMASDLQPVAFFQNAGTASYVTESEAPDVVGRVVLVPQKAGQPLLKGSVLAPGNERLAGILADDNGMSLVPLPLDLSNVIAPDVDDIYPGDRLLLTAFFKARPSRFEFGESGVVQTTPTPPTVVEEASMGLDVSAEIARLRPPVAKVLFPKGLQVVAVYGKTPVQTSSLTEGDPNQDLSSVSIVAMDEAPVVLLKVPADQVETLTLALGQADLITVGLVGRVDGQPDMTPGYTFDDFEAWLADERTRAAIQDLLGVEVNNPDDVSEESPFPTPTPEPQSFEGTFTADELAVLVQAWVNTLDGGANSTVFTTFQNAMLSAYPDVMQMLLTRMIAMNNSEDVANVISTLAENGYLVRQGADPLPSEMVAACFEGVASGVCTLTDNGNGTYTIAMELQQ